MGTKNAKRRVIDFDKDFPLMKVDSQGVHVESDFVAEKLDKISLSASTISRLESCPASLIFDKYVKNHVLPEEKDSPGRRGNAFHDIMEKFFTIEPAEGRTPGRLTQVTKEVLLDKYPDFAESPDVIQWIHDCIAGYYSMGGKPQKVEIADVVLPAKHHDTENRTEKGLEVFVKGAIGDSSRETLGFIDQVIVDNTEPGSVIVSDWKTGKVKKFDKKKKSDTGFNEVRQQVIYSMLLQRLGVSVSSARLIHPLFQTIVPIDVHDDEINKKVVESVENADTVLSESIENNTFEFGPSFLCSWCPMAKICPAADIQPYEKHQKAFASQYEFADMLGAVKIQ